jgi:Cadherin domain
MVSTPENTTSVLTVTATDADLPAQLLNFSIIGGADQSKFAITPAGALSFIAPPDFESPTDSNGDNVYVVIVQASDGNFTSLQAILVTVTNVIGPLPPGDYDDNGVVDTSDYVVWRNSLGQSGSELPADGNGNGVVDQADYDLWRANYGRVAEPGAAAFLDVVSRPTSQAPEEMSVALVETESATNHADAPPRPAAVIIEAALTSTRISRPARRDLLTATVVQDDALVAWLSSLNDGQGGPATVMFGELPEELTNTDWSDHSCDSLDMAYASLGAVETFPIT